MVDPQQSAACLQKDVAVLAAALPGSDGSAGAKQFTTGRLGPNQLPGLSQSLLQIPQKADPTDAPWSASTCALVDGLARVLDRVVEDRHAVDSNCLSVAD